MTDATHRKMSREEAIEQCKKAGFTIVNSTHHRFQPIDNFSPDEAIEDTWGCQIINLENGILLYE